MVTDRDYGTPDLGTIRRALTLAGRAPSVHNTQPWRWEFDDNRLRLYRVQHRQLSVADPDGRQQAISCGAALDHARLAFMSLGWFTFANRIPDAHQPDLLAVLEFRPWHGALNQTAARVRAIAVRHTDRLPMAPPEDWPTVLDTLRELARPHHVTVDEIGAEHRRTLIAGTEHATALHRHDRAYQQELDWWSAGSGSFDGIPAAARASVAEAERVGVGRAFPSPPYSNRRPDLDDHSRLVVLGTAGHSPGEWMDTGEALSQVLLECTHRGLASCPLTHLTESEATSTMVADLLPHPAVPQVLIRIGTATREGGRAPTPRRTLSDVFDHSTTESGSTRENSSSR
ncbi:Acg family FMN-binding oxidoreductase [Nocardia sp. NPDC052316]|uniref:Acg family FMN-binding oxidoreductase n=1 Tax=Nocardia sp. NPDC052316 TaxID=3364329 RepID=UPI0037C9427E